MDTNPTDGLPPPEDPLGQVRRSPMEMVCDILGVLAGGPTRPTHILYKANMSWKVLSTYLDYLQEKGLIEKEAQGGKRCTYNLTQKGKSILQLYDGLRISLTGGIKGEGDKSAKEILDETSKLELRVPSSIWT